MKIIKADGTSEEFDPRKLVKSLKKAGAQYEEIRRIVSTIESSLTEGMQSQVIYRKAFQLLRESADPAAARYSLRRAVFSLGPTGFPFEDFLARLFQAEGYKTKLRIALKGKCVVHEIDIAAYSPKHSFVAEAKFHSHPGIKSDLQVAMYSYARYLDLKSSQICKDDICGVISLSVITNTKFTHSAIKYASCAGIDLLSWDYPKHDSLHTKIQKHSLYPITVLSSLSNSQKQQLLARKAILCTDILKKPQFLDGLGLSSKKTKATLSEISLLTGSK